MSRKLEITFGQFSAESDATAVGSKGGKKPLEHLSNSKQPFMEGPHQFKCVKIRIMPDVRYGP